MKEKKEKYRFTIQFNSDDLLHQWVAGILNCQGRHKAQYLVNAVCTYENRVEPTSAESAPVDYKTIASIVNQILVTKSAQQSQTACQAKKQTEIAVSQSEELNFEEDVLDILEQNGLSVIAESIAAFRRKE